MSRIRWYYFYFVLAIFDVFVIMLSLSLHSRSNDSVARLINETLSLDDESRWLQRAQQRIVELNAPGNDLFRSADLELQDRRFRRARMNLEAVLNEASPGVVPLDALHRDVNLMIHEEEALFAAFKAPRDENAADRVREANLARAGEAMARMDEAQHAAIRTLSEGSSRNAIARQTLIQEHAQELQDRSHYERYFIAAVVVILIGMFAFGRRLQLADRALEGERRRVIEERRERLAAIGELSSSVAHGIRNPLAAIRSSAQLTLQLGRMDDDSRERLRDILEEGARLGDRVTGLLSMSKASSDTFTPVDLRSVVSAAVRSLAPEFEKRRFRLIEQESPQAVMVRGDAHQLEQIVVELLSNALEHSPVGGEVRVSCPSVNGTGMGRITVEDQGAGVPEEVRPRIFDLFFTSKPTGTGIGLATAKRYARLHNGDVCLETPEQGGARFVVTIPTMV